jgi:hypothetical protein
VERNARTTENSLSARTSVRAGGWAPILGAMAFMGVFGVLASRFNYPVVLLGHRVKES